MSSCNSARVLSPSKLKLVRKLLRFKNHFLIIWYLRLPLNSMAAGRQLSVQRLATGCTVQGSKPCDGKIFCACPGRPRTLRSSIYSSNCVSFSAVKRRGSLLDHPLPSNADEVNEQRNIPAPPSGFYYKLQGDSYRQCSVISLTYLPPIQLPASLFKFVPCPSLLYNY